jgi:RNA polymerase sigma-70 factor, ECF subfamily
VESAEKQMLRFSGTYKPDDSQDAEAREDARLLAAIAEGDQHALAALYRRRGGLLYSLLIRMLVNEMEAQEVMQDTFVLIWRRAHEYDPGRSSPLAWMIMMARGRAIDQLRARSRRAVNHAAYEREVVSLEVEINGSRQMERDELAAACASALNALPEAQGHALQLAFLRGWTHEEIAGAAGEPLGTVKARIRRGLLSLRKILKDYDA